jgi:hypothetical protein
VPWLERALAANDGSASIKAAERLGNLRGRLAWHHVEQARTEHDRLRRELESAAPRPATALRRRAEAAARALQQAAHAARDALGGAVALLDQLVALQPTMERASLCGSVYKRLALVEAATGRADAETAAIRRMQAQYRRAEAIGRAAGLPDFYYPALNRMAAELALAQPGWRGFARDETAAVRQALATQARDDPDFWSIAGLIELRLYEALAARRLAAQRASIEDEYADLRLRVAAPSRWASVHDQLAFVLPRYAAHAAAAERDAATALLRLVAPPQD